jgi:hypothetical protein
MGEWPPPKAAVVMELNSGLVRIYTHMRLERRGMEARDEWLIPPKRLWPWNSVTL